MPKKKINVGWATLPTIHSRVGYAHPTKLRFVIPAGKPHPNLPCKGKDNRLLSRKRDNHDWLAVSAA